MSTTQMDRSGEAVHGLLVPARGELRTPDRSCTLCRCGCGMAVMGRRWYAWKCPTREVQLAARKLKANERYRRKCGIPPRQDRVKINQQTYARHGRWLADDDHPDVIEQKFTAAKEAMRHARRKAQAA